MCDTYMSQRIQNNKKKGTMGTKIFQMIPPWDPDGIEVQKDSLGDH